MKNYQSTSRWPVLICLLSALVLTACASKTSAPVVDRGALSKDAYVVKKGDTLYSIASAHGMDFRELITMNGIVNPSQITVGQVLKIKPSTAAAASAGAGTGAATTAPVTNATVLVQPISMTPIAPAGSSGGLKPSGKAGKVAYSDEALAQAQAEDSGKTSESMAKAEVKPEPKAEAKSEPKPEVKPDAKAESAVENDELVWIWPVNGKVIGTFSASGSKGIDISGKAGDPVIAVGDGKIVYSGTGLRGYGKLVIVKHNNTYLSAYAHNQTIFVKEGQSVSKGQKIADMGNTDADQVKLHFEIRRNGTPVDPLKYLPQR